MRLLSSRSPAEDVTAMLGLVVCPVADFVIVLFAGVWRETVVALLVLPLAFAAGSLVLGSVLGTRVSWRLVTCSGCLLLCFTASGAARLLGIFDAIYAGF
jgi:hypothetical protein